MLSVTRRDAVRFLTAGAIAVAAGPQIAHSAEEKPLTPEVIVAKKFQGQATVELAVSSVERMTTGRLNSDECPIHITDKSCGVAVVVDWPVTIRLMQLGITNIVEHFRGQVIEVSGTVEYFEGGFGPINFAGRAVVDKGPEYRIVMTSLEQFKAIRKP